MRINTNIAALNSYNQLKNTQNNLSKSLQRLSSGKRINGAADDAAGLAISEKMGGQVRGLGQAQRNAQDGISMIQTAEGALKETHSILQRMRELSVQSANDTNTEADRAEIQEEVNQLSKELTRISNTTEFNTQKLLDGTLENTFQIGSNENQNLELDVNEMSADALNVVNDTISMGKNGNGVTDVEADMGINVENYSLKAEAGDPTTAKLDSVSGAVNTDGAAEEIDVQYSKGVTVNGGDLPDSWTDGEIKVSDDTVSGTFKWSEFDSGTIDIKTDASGAASGELEVVIDATDSSGNTLVVTDSISANEDGNYSYDNHGLDFDFSEDDYADFDSININASDELDGDNLADENIDMKNNWESNSGGAGNISDPISFDPGDAGWIEGTENIMIEHADDGGGASGTVTVTLQDASGNDLASDAYNFDTDASDSGTVTFSYEEHGVSFDLEVDQTDLNSGSTLEFGVSGNTNINVYDNSLNFDTDQTLEFSYTNSDGGTEDVSVDFDKGLYDIDDIVSDINAEAPDDVADFDPDTGELTLASTGTGTDSSINVTSDISSTDTTDIFDTGDATGDDTSVDFELLDQDGNVEDNQDEVGASEESVSFDVGGNDMTFSIANMESAELNQLAEDDELADYFSASDFTREVTGIDVSSQEAADKAISTIDQAIEDVSSERSKLGAVQNRLEHTINNLGTAEENLTAAESRISDVDMAEEMMSFTKSQILSQAGTSMLAQANQLPQGVLQLLG